VLKLLSGRVQQEAAELVVEMMGPAGMLCEPYSSGVVDEGDGSEERPRDAVLAFVGSPGGTIAGGTNDIQKNILGERVLGLPREPGFDPNTPWSQIPRS
jgi:alkylation response protein AidB-like acyl-CoA dehydrogenase